MVVLLFSSQGHISEKNPPKARHGLIFKDSCAEPFAVLSIIMKKPFLKL
jgi:hypothetical protein